MRPALRAAALAALGACALTACARRSPAPAPVPTRPMTTRESANPAVFWNDATVYFLLTDRFFDGDTSNDRALGRAHDGAVLRSFEGGDLKGVLEKIETGWFDSLGVNVIWLTPFVEQIRGKVDEGWGETYAYHGYWGRDWTAVDPALGTRDDLRALVDAAHRHRIRVLMDAVINHVGPVTAEDPAWPDDWVRPGPACAYRSYATTVECNLVPTLPDIRTESETPVDLPPWLVEKWRREGRLDTERASLDSFFARTHHPRAPRWYFIKWLTDWVREFGIDGYRMDTAKHFGEDVSVEVKREAERGLAQWKRAHPEKAIDDLPFYMVGEVSGWDPGQGRRYNFGDSTVDFFAHGYDALINFGFKRDAAWPLDSLFRYYSQALRIGPLYGVSILNYVDSHDDGAPYDVDRRDPFGAGTRLLLSAGGAQIYYGDELARPLKVAGAQGDANLRSFMNWSDLKSGSRSDSILEHWRKLGRFRRAHPSIGSGEYRRLQAQPLVFARTLSTDEIDDRVVVALDVPAGAKSVPVFGVFPDGSQVLDSYSGTRVAVTNGSVTLTTPFTVVLLGQRSRAFGSDSTVQVNVTNNYAMPMEIYASSAASTYHLGVVNPGIVSHFVLRQAMLKSGGQVTFYAQPSGYGPQINGGELHLIPGDIVDFEIATNLVGSRATVRP